MAADFRHHAEFLWAEIETFYGALLRGDNEEAAVQMHHAVREVRPVLIGIEMQWQTLTLDQRLWCQRLISDLTMVTQALEMLKQLSPSTDLEEERNEDRLMTRDRVGPRPTS